MRFFKLWVAMTPVALVLALLLVFAASVFAITNGSEVSIPLFVDVAIEDDAPVWDLYPVGIGLSVLVLPPLAAGAISLLSRNDDKGEQR